MTEHLIAGFVAINLLTVSEFWSDRQKSRSGAWRTPEARPLGLALFGGSPGAFLARSLFRHKTRKQPFGTYLYIIAFGQIGGLIGYALA